jgi:hypothetical protein
LDASLTDERRGAGAFAALQACARSLDAPLLAAATNWQQVMPPLPGHLGYVGAVLAIPVLLSRRYGYAVHPASWTYQGLRTEETTPLTDPLLGRPGFPIRHHGAWARRIDKAAALASWPEAMQHLRPCDEPTADGGACGKCRKCIHTALSFCALGLPVPPAFGGRPPALEDLARFKMTPYSALALRDAIGAARQRGATDPWIALAEQRIADFEAQSN